MLKKYFLVSILAILSLNAKNITKNECLKLSGNYIFSAKECIQYAYFEGEKKDKLIVIIHGAWKEGTDTLAHYKPFAENLNMDTDITTIAIALPGYSNSSTNNLQALTHNKNALKMASSKEYINFLATLLKDLKIKYKAKELTVISHSAGAMATATLLGYRPNLIQNVALAGGRYNIHKISKEKELISAIDYINNIPKDTKILLIYGGKDTISTPSITKDFYKLAKEKKLNVNLIEVKDATHLDLDMQEESINAVEKMLSIHQ